MASKYHSKNLWYISWLFAEVKYVDCFIGGNARDLAREKNQKKQQEQAKKKGISDKGSNQGLTLEQRKQR